VQFLLSEVKKTLFRLQKAVLPTKKQHLTCFFPFLTCFELNTA